MGTSHKTETVVQRFEVPFEYPVSFTRGVFERDNPVLAEMVDRLSENRRHRLQFFIDSGVAHAYPELPARIADYCDSRPGLLSMEGPPEIVPGGEEAKNTREAAERVMQCLADRHLCRQSYVVAIGGGSALDIIGLAASLVHRGLRLVRVATTVLAQNDSAVGVKNGIDAYGVKNFAGTFVPPFAVISDFDFLETLSDKYWIGGMAEAYKVAIIKDRQFLEYLCANAALLRRRDAAVAEEAIKRSALLHLEHIRTNGDPFEFGTARPLDFGHWSAHRIEVMSGYEIGHGQAVAIGTALDIFYACECKLVSESERDQVLNALLETGLPVWSGILERRATDGRLAILRGIDEFREHLGGNLNVTLPAGLGQRTEVHEMDCSIIERGAAYLKELAQEDA